MGADFFGASSVASALGIRPGATPCGQSMAANRHPLQRETILAVNLYDPALTASFGDGKLRRALGALCETHDFVAQSRITHLLADIRDRPCDVSLLHFAP